MLALALAVFVVGLRVFVLCRQMPGPRVAWYADGAQWLGLTAVGWLTANAMLLALAAAAIALPTIGRVPIRLETHILGTGFVTLLILGEGVKLLPGFAH